MRRSVFKGNFRRLPVRFYRRLQVTTTPALISTCASSAGWMSGTPSVCFDVETSGERKQAVIDKWDNTKDAKTVGPRQTS